MLGLLLRSLLVLMLTLGTLLIPLVLSLLGSRWVASAVALHPVSVAATSLTTVKSLPVTSNQGRLMFSLLSLSSSPFSIQARDSIHGMMKFEIWVGKTRFKFTEAFALLHRMIECETCVFLQCVIAGEEKGRG